MVSGVIIAAAMNALVDDNPPLVFQASSGDSNPNDMKRIVGLVGLYKRQHFEDKETGNSVVNKLAVDKKADFEFVQQGKDYVITRVR